jgi:uncharacterized protein YndB with AHSA1/START domain
MKRIQNEIEVPGTPEEVWEAIATGHGIECWFVPAQVGERVALDMGDGLADAGPVTASEPPHRFVYEEDWQAVEGEPPGRLASEFLVEAKAGGTCVVRIVSTLHADGEGWDAVMDQMRLGWDTFLLNLQAYLRHFPGQRCATVMASADGDWPSFLAALGLTDAQAGDAVRTPQAPTLAGTVEYRGERELLLKLAEPAPGLGLVYAYDWEDQTKTVVHLYLFEDSFDVAAREAPAWREWISASPASSPA